MEGLEARELKNFHKRFKKVDNFGCSSGMMNRKNFKNITLNTWSTPVDQIV